MASDGVPVSIPASLVQGGQAPKLNAAQLSNGKTLPPSGSKTSVDTAKAAAQSTAQSNGQPKTATATNKAELEALVAQLNKYLNDSGRSYQFRVDPTSRNQTIQEINPASGEVVGEFAASLFPALARSLGVSGVLVNDHA